MAMLKSKDPLVCAANEKEFTLMALKASVAEAQALIDREQDRIKYLQQQISDTQIVLDKLRGA